MRLVDADEAGKYLYEHLDDLHMIAAQNAIDEMPTVDVQPMKNDCIKCSERTEEFLDRLAKLMRDYGFDNVYAENGKVVFVDEESGHHDRITFSHFHEGSVVDVTSTQTYLMDYYAYKY